MLRRIFAEPSISILIVAIVLSLVFLINSYNERKQLGAEVSRLSKKVEELSDLKVGDLVPSIEMADLQGKSTKLSYQGEEKHALIVFSPDCTACKIQEFSVWNKFASQAEAKGYLVHGVLLNKRSETETFLTSHKAGFEVLTPDTELFRRCYRISRVPQIIFTDRAGKVTYIHHGTLQEDGLEPLMSTLDKLKIDSQQERTAILRF
jgi:thioredoxin-related protein